MEFNSENIKTRRAQTEDYDAIMEIGDVLGGKDYLSSKYFTFMNDPDIHPMLAEVNGKPVAFDVAQILDGGKTVVKRSARTHRSYRGGGVFRILSNELDRYIKSERPNVEFDILGTSDEVGGDITKFLRKGYVEIYRKRLLNMIFKVTDLQGVDNPQKFSQVQKMTHEDVRLLFQNDDMVNRLFPKKRLFNFFIGYRLMEENIRHVVNDTAEVYVTLTDYPSGDGKCDDFDSRNTEVIDILSCSHHYQAEKGLVYEVSIYAINEFDYKNLEAHVKKHVAVMRKLATSEGIMMLMFDLHIDDEKVLANLRAVGISQFLPFKEKYAILYERSLKTNQV